MSDINLARSLRDIDRLQDEVLAELDDLNRRIEHTILRFTAPCRPDTGGRMSPPAVEVSRLADGPQDADGQKQRCGIAQHAGDGHPADGPHVEADEDR